MRAPTLPFLLAAASLASAQTENDHYTVEHFPVPEGARFEVGGLDFLSDGRLVFSTRRGQVWILENPEVEDVADARFTLFAEGLSEGLGLEIVDDRIYVMQRSELSLLRDEDGDGFCDHIDTITNDWGMSGNYHEFAFGMPTDAEGNFYVTLNLAFFSPKWWHGKSAQPYRGWALRISPTGEVTPWAYGFRSPCGVGRDAEGRIFVTDNQGDWCASSPIYHLVEGAFYSHPASLEWTEEYKSTGTRASDMVPPAAAARRKPPAIWIPYEWSRSTGNMEPDLTDGAFGPFARQMFVAELTNGMLLRADMEEVQGELQGWVVPFRTNDVGSAVRVRFAPDGSLFCGLTNRGWGGRSPADGIARIRFTGKTPMEIDRVHLLQDGFEVGFTLPVAAGTSIETGDVDLYQYDYNYWWEYGSPEQHRTQVEVTSTALSSDRRTLTVRTAGITPAMVARMQIHGVRAEGGLPLVHGDFAYTVNQLPEGPRVEDLVAKVVPPPPGRESGDQGWLMLSWGDATAAWNQEGWELCDADLAPDDKRSFRTVAGNGALVNTGERPSHFVSKAEFGDQKVRLDFMLPEGGNSGVYLMGRYEVQLLDSTGVRDPGFGDCGGIYRGDSFPGKAPAFNVFKGAGQWHRLEVVFRAPRFDAAGKKVRNARFERVLMDGHQLQENVQVSEPTLAAISMDEVAAGPLMLQGDHGPVAFRDIRVMPLNPAPSDDEEGWQLVFPEESFDDWPISGDAEWELDDDTITGGGKRGHLFSPRGDYLNFELRGEVKVNEGGNSGLYFRTAFGPGWPTGYEAQVNTTHPDPVKTGSLYNLALVKTQLIPADTWFRYHVTCQDTETGTHIVIRVNGTVITDFVDERRHAAGHIALQQHHEGSAVQFRNLRIKER